MPQLDQSPPRDDELPVLADDVGYEVVMFDRAFRWASIWPDVMARQGGLTDDQTDRRNGDIEVLLLHARNLTDFFESKPTQSRSGDLRDDVVAHHFVPGWSAADGGAALRRLLAHRPWINKRVQHITATRARVPSEETERLLIELFEDVMTLVHQFLGRLSVERRRWFEPRLRSSRGEDGDPMVRG